MPGVKSKVTGYLLSRPPADDRSAIDTAMDEALRVLPELARGDWQRASTELHTRTKG